MFHVALQNARGLIEKTFTICLITTQQINYSYIRILLMSLELAVWRVFIAEVAVSLPGWNISNGLGTNFCCLKAYHILLNKCTEIWVVRKIPIHSQCAQVGSWYYPFLPRDNHCLSQWLLRSPEKLNLNISGIIRFDFELMELNYLEFIWSRWFCY